jgi:hypothetical protein
MTLEKSQSLVVSAVVNLENVTELESGLVLGVINGVGVRVTIEDELGVNDIELTGIMGFEGAFGF